MLGLVIVVGADGDTGAVGVVGVDEVCETSTVVAPDESGLDAFGAELSVVEGAVATEEDAAGVEATVEEELAIAIGFAAACAVVPASAGEVP